MIELPDGTVSERVYANAIEGYDDIFTTLLNPKDKKMCMDILEGFYNNPDYIYSGECR